MSSAKMANDTDQADVKRWKERLQANPYRSYLYSYPHKTAYRELTPKLSLGELWREEPADTFFLYMHIPFCGARCGFCNLFTLPDKRSDTHREYVDALERQAKQWAPYVGHKPFARFAIGGGTPTLLEPELLGRLFDIAEQVMGLDSSSASISVETSPETVDSERMRLLKERRVDRISMGIQSFVEAEAAAVYRPQMPQEVERALEVLKRYAFPVLNLDLIYGLPGQTVESWLYSLEKALSYEPEELFIYPLYTREHTIVKPEQVRRQGEDLRMACYTAARERLLARGYTQYSMRRFAREAGSGLREVAPLTASKPGRSAESVPSPGSGKALLPYGCQEEGMVGLGCGARSYTRSVHYATRYGVSRQATQSIIADYVAAQRYDIIDYGFVLSREEQQRRFVLKALLHREGLSLQAYEQRFGSAVFRDIPELVLLAGSDWAVQEDGLLRLTDEGLAYSDAIGDWLISPEVRQRMEGYVFT